MLSEHLPQAHCSSRCQTASRSLLWQDAARLRQASRRHGYRDADADPYCQCDANAYGRRGYGNRDGHDNGGASDSDLDVRRARPFFPLQSVTDVLLPPHSVFETQTAFRDQPQVVVTATYYDEAATPLLYETSTSTHEAPTPTQTISETAAASTTTLTVYTNTTLVQQTTTTTSTVYSQATNCASKVRFFPPSSPFFLVLTSSPSHRPSEHKPSSLSLCYEVRTVSLKLRPSTRGSFERRISL